jgi:hypothetical protein
VYVRVSQQTRIRLTRAHAFRFRRPYADKAAKPPSPARSNVFSRPAGGNPATSLASENCAGTELSCSKPRPPKSIQNHATTRPETGRGRRDSLARKCGFLIRSHAEVRLVLAAEDSGLPGFDEERPTEPQRTISKIKRPHESKGVLSTPPDMRESRAVLAQDRGQEPRRSPSNVFHQSDHLMALLSMLEYANVQCSSQSFFDGVSVQPIEQLHLAGISAARTRHRAERKAGCLPPN